MTSGEPNHTHTPGRMQQLVLLARAHPVRTFIVLLPTVLGLWLLAGRVFPSEKNRIRHTLRELRDGVVQGDADKVLAHVSPYFSEEGIDKERLAAWLRVALPLKRTDRAILIMRHVLVRRHAAEVTLSVRSWHKGHFTRTEWIIMLELINDRWLVRRATPTDLDQRPSVGFRALLRLG